MGYGISDEKGRKNVNGIVEVSHKHYCAEENRGGDEKPAQVFIIPKNQRHQERQTGVAREEQVISGGENAEQSGCGYLIVDRKRTDMGQTYENRADNYEKSDAFKREWDFLRFKDQVTGHKYPKQNWTIDENHINVKNWEVAQYNVGDGTACPVGGVNNGKKTYDDT